MLQEFSQFCYPFGNYGQKFESSLLTFSIFESIRHFRTMFVNFHLKIQRYCENILKFSMIVTDSSNKTFQCFVQFYQNKDKRNIEKLTKNSCVFFVWKKENNGQGNQDTQTTIYCQQVSNDKLKSFFVDFCENFMNMS